MHVCVCVWVRWCVCVWESVCALSNSVHWHHQQRNALFSATQSSCRQTNTTLFYSELLIHQTNSVFVCVALFNCRVWLFCYFDSIDLCDQQKKYFNPFFHQHFHPLFILFEWTVRRLEWTWGCLRTKKNSLGWKKFEDRKKLLSSFLAKGRKKVKATSSCLNISTPSSKSDFLFSVCLLFQIEVHRSQ
jgi:hypothetical protein